MSYVSQAEKEAIAKEALAKHHPMIIPAIKDIREQLDCGLMEAKELADLIRFNEPSKVDQGVLDLARKVLSIHGPDPKQAARELKPRLNGYPDASNSRGCTLAEAEALIKLVSPDPPRTSTEPQYEWNAKSAEKWLRRYATHLRREAKYISENANGFAFSEDEFRCGLANGLGIDEDKEQDEIIAEIHEGKKKEK